MVIFAAIDVGMLKDGFDARTRFLVELLQAEISQHTVFACDGNDVGGNAHGQKVDEVIHLFNSAQAFHREGGNQFETHTTTRELVVGISAVGTFGIENSHSIGDDIAGTMVVADDEINAALVGIVDTLVGLDATVQGNDQLETIFGCIVNAFEGNAVSFFVAVGDVELDFFLLEEGFQIGVNYGHGCGTINVIIAINQKFLTILDGLQHSIDRFVHVLHQERIVQLRE